MRGPFRTIESAEEDEMRTRHLIPALLFAALPLLASDPNDKEGCQDHPLFTRMRGYFIGGCESNPFASEEFATGPRTTVKVEGRFTKIGYSLNEGAPRPSALQVMRNYENAVKAIGGSVLATVDGAMLYMKVAKDGKEFWAYVNVYNSEFPSLTIIEKAAMEQEVAANADVFANGIRATGHVAVYGIYFDTNKADVKPESKPALSEIAKLLKKDAGLKLYVVGHTDGTGLLDANMKLSQARAESFVKALVAEHGIAAVRLKGLGVGPAAPVASNDSEDGRAKNRRVELVKQ
jgi:OmpA-OmpF porin, OOP family